jgi:hypothetical protein
MTDISNSKSTNTGEDPTTIKEHPNNNDSGNEPGDSNSSNNNSNKQQQQQKQDKEPIEYNPRAMGYIYIMLSSLVNFAAVSNVPNNERAAFWYMSIAFGVLTFVLSCLIMLQDWTQRWISYGDYNIAKARDGYFEGYILFFMVLWWIYGVGNLTRPGGIAYVASNIYYSAWLSFFSCVYTLNEWSASKDILSIQEITSISPTLKFWWLHFLSACIVFGSCVDITIRFDQPWNQFGDSR